MRSFDKKVSKNVFVLGGVYAILLTIRKIGSGNAPFNVLRNQIVDFAIGSPGNVMWYIGVMLFISLLLKLIIDFDKNIYKGKGQILRSTPNTAPLICGAYNTQPEGLSTMA